MRITRIVLALLVVGAAIVLSCSKKSSSPTAPGGGGGATETFDSGAFSSGGVFVHTFNTSGTYRYHCSFHGTQTSGMFGDVVVSAAGGDSPLVVTPSLNFSPQTVNVKPGGYVKWMNNTATPHTVTRP